MKKNERVKENIYIKRIAKLLFVGLLTVCTVGCSASSKESAKNEDKANLQIVADAFVKNDELQSYHMVSNIEGEAFDVNIENVEGTINMAGTKTYEAPIYSHSDLSEVGKETVTEYIYKKGEASMNYRTRDGIVTQDVSLENLSFKDSLKEIEYFESLEDDNGYVKDITAEKIEDGSTTITINSTQEVFVISADGILQSYKGQTGEFVIDTLNEAVLDYTYCSI